MLQEDFSLDYLAGFFEGEGHLGVVVSRSSSEWGYSLTPQAAIHISKDDNMIFRGFKDLIPVDWEEYSGKRNDALLMIRTKEKLQTFLSIMESHFRSIRIKRKATLLMQIIELPWIGISEQKFIEILKIVRQLRDKPRKGSVERLDKIILELSE
jgi:hypothetical protein